MIKKKAIGDVVSTVLIILLVVSAVAIVGAIVIKVLHDAPNINSGNENDSTIYLDNMTSLLNGKCLALNFDEVIKEGGNGLSDPKYYCVKNQQNVAVKFTKIGSEYYIITN